MAQDNDTPTKTVVVRMSRKLFERIEQWRESQIDPPKQSSAVRQLLAYGLAYCTLLKTGKVEK